MSPGFLPYDTYHARCHTHARYMTLLVLWHVLSPFPYSVSLLCPRLGVDPPLDTPTHAHTHLLILSLPYADIVGIDFSLHMHHSAAITLAVEEGWGREEEQTEKNRCEEDEDVKRDGATDDVKRDVTTEDVKHDAVSEPQHGTHTDTKPTHLSTYLITHTRHMLEHIFTFFPPLIRALLWDIPSFTSLMLVLVCWMCLSLWLTGTLALW